jgi:hypothetical protein
VRIPFITYALDPPHTDSFYIFFAFDFLVKNSDHGSYEPNVHSSSNVPEMPGWKKRHCWPSKWWSFMLIWMTLFFSSSSR